MLVVAKAQILPTPLFCVFQFGGRDRVHVGTRRQSLASKRVHINQCVHIGPVFLHNKRGSTA